MNYAATSSKRTFARHFAEMVLAMFVGMGVLGGLAELTFAATGSGLSAQSTELRVMLMGAYMTLPMVAWMSYRGHDGQRNLEMAASMILPTVVVAVLASLGALELGAAMGIQHGVMIPAMLAVMVWRYHDYARPH
jgi:uncharacterized membrane protein YhaH (DUF805 family)